MPKKKNTAKQSPAPATESEQKPDDVSSKERLKDIGSGLGYLFSAIALLIYGILGLYTGELRILMIGGTASSGVFLHGPAVWSLFLAYAGLSVYLITLGLDYLSKQDEHAKRAKVAYAAGMLAAAFYILALMMSGMFGEDGHLLSTRLKVFGVYYNLHGSALWSAHLFSVCMAIFVITFLPWRTKNPNISDKVRSVAWKLMMVFLFGTEALVLVSNNAPISVWIVLLVTSTLVVFLWWQRSRSRY